MSTEAEEIQRTISAAVRDLLDAYRLHAADGPVTDTAREDLVFRGAQGVLRSVRLYSREQRVALLPNLVRMLLAAFVGAAAREPKPSTEGGTH